MSVRERTRRIAGKAGLAFAEAPADAATPVLLVNAAFAFDPPLLGWMTRQAGTVLKKDGIPAIAHVTDAAAVPAAIAWMAGQGGQPPGLTEIVHDAGFTLYNDQLRKREQPFLEPLTPATVRTIERRSYYAAYKGVTDILTKYLWPEWALVLTRIAARIGMTPNMVTGIGAILCVAAFFLFADGHYWAGMGAGLGFMVLDTVDGKLARCTITSSRWGNVFDHGIDLVHPPFWWWAWGAGLGTWGLGLPPERFLWVMIAIVGGYVVQRLIEGTFIRSYGIHIHVWERTDSRFRLITARRNPNMVILLASVIAGRPDLGLVGVAWWTMLSLLFHAVRLAQAMVRKAGGRPITSWLVE
ncbi:CDP-alcohol phosphatidyltransferase family protein [Sphingomonas solaris]|uniref:CDP-alcohol phosphatidyltransferase family protein n=2 Tax=Alterirhizorhabdus solaris TaxID=2529389 RepID=A0A558R6R4_9SPHN|nr:CDP-alcohol phosphatidyltransferase family protein [Sphingomonas solaris]